MTIDASFRHAKVPRGDGRQVMANVRMRVSVLLIMGEWAELTTPDRDHRDPERVKAQFLSQETGIPVGKLPGKDLVALVDEGGELVGFERP